MITGIAPRCSMRCSIASAITMTIVTTMMGVLIALAGAGTASASDRHLGVNCVQLFPQEGGEVLINGCAVCRRVGVERARPGTQFPTARTVIVPEQSRIELSFLGPGRTRLTSEEECRIAARPDEAVTGRSDGRRCVQFARSRGAYLLVNGCSTCRSVAVLRTDPAGRQNRGTYHVAPQSSLPYPADGGLNAAITGDIPCQ